MNDLICAMLDGEFDHDKVKSLSQRDLRKLATALGVRFYSADVLIRKFDRRTKLAKLRRLEYVESVFC